jgi:hypothetical protein
MSKHDVTIRKGTSERHWYAVAGHVIGAVAGLLFAVFQYTPSSNQSLVGFTISLIILWLIVSVTGFVSMVGIFKDAAYLSGSGIWTPNWWRYVGAGAGVPIVVAFILGFVITQGEAITYSILLFGISSTTVSIVYLYRRHCNVGVP